LKEYVSSDTNLWIDFMEVDKLSWPFLLPYVYLMSKETMDNELLYPRGLREKLIDLGLKETDIEIKELYMVEEFISRYKRLSKADCVALAIAKNRKIVLITGDKNLRLAASSEGVDIKGTLGIMDELLQGAHIKVSDYKKTLKSFLSRKNNRLPVTEIEKRIK